MTHLKDQRGVAFILEAILVAVVLVAIGFGVYTYAHASKHKTTSVATPKPTTVASVTATPKPTNELDIPELGIKIMLPDGLKDVIYVVAVDKTGTDSNGASYQYSTARFSTKELQSAGPYCTAEESTLGVIVKYPFDPVASGVLGSGYSVIKAGSSYYTYAGPQATCSDDPSVQAEQGTAMPLMHVAFESISALK